MLAYVMKFSYLAAKITINKILTYGKSKHKI